MFNQTNTNFVVWRGKGLKCVSVQQNLLSSGEGFSDCCIEEMRQSIFHDVMLFDNFEISLVNQNYSKHNENGISSSPAILENLHRDFGVISGQLKSL